MEKQENQTIKDKLFYNESVELAFRAFDKEVVKCMSKVANCLLVSCGVDGPDSQKILQLLNFLNLQHQNCINFIKDYGKLEETV